MTKLNKVWEKASTVRGKNPEVWRRDCEGNIIRKGSYGTCGEFGWHVDHIHPKAKGGTDGRLYAGKGRCSAEGLTKIE